MTIAAAFRCDGGIVLGADTEETVGDIKQRAFKIPRLEEPYCTAMITGACENAHLMDTMVERIFDRITSDKPTFNHELFEGIRQEVLTLYSEEFKVDRPPNS